MKPKNRTLAAIADSGLKSAPTVGAYVNLLIHHSVHGKLPMDSEALREIAGIGSAALGVNPWSERIWPGIKPLFYREGDDIHPRVSRAPERKEVGVPCTRETMTKVMTVWNKVMPELPAAQVAGEDRFKAFAARWQEASTIKTSEQDGYTDEAGGLRWWRGLFMFMRTSKFLMGKSSEWRASFDFPLQQSSFRKIIEGQYK